MAERQPTTNQNASTGSPSDAAPRSAPPTSLPTISQPTGGGAIRGIGEKLSINPVTGTSALSVPVGTSASRGDFAPQLTLTYDSGAGNGPYGLGWQLALPT